MDFIRYWSGRTEISALCLVNWADETRVASRRRVEIHRARELQRLGHVVAQESFRPVTVVRRLHPRPVE